MIRKTCLVIGATRGIGAAVAQRFSQEAYLTAGTHRGAGDVADGIIPIEMDLRHDSSIVAGFAAALEALGGIDVLVVASGITKDGLLLRASEEDVNEIFRVNAIGPVLATKAALKIMLRQRAGSIVILSSMSVRYGVAGQTTYTATKGAIEAFSKSFAREYAGRGIRMNVVAPGATDTQMVAAMTAEDRSAMMAGVPLGRLATPLEIADAVFHTAQNTYMSGSVVSVSGGA